jgi:hypothetical protein
MGVGDTEDARRGAATEMVITMQSQRAFLFSSFWGLVILSLLLCGLHSFDDQLSRQRSTIFVGGREEGGVAAHVSTGDLARPI